MKATVRLFKAIPISTKKKITSRYSEYKKLMETTIKNGFILSEEVIYNYSNSELNQIIKTVNAEFGLSAEQMNSSFHKSWKKIKEATIEQLVIEQLIHYLTTYGFEAFGCYSEGSIYIPPEKLEIPQLKDGVKLIVIKGLTHGELKEKLLTMLQSGIALKEDTIKDVLDVAGSFPLSIGLSEKEIEGIKNKEAKIALYDYLGLVPENPVEFLRYIVYKSTDKTLLIKDKATIETIKTKKNLDVLKHLLAYKSKYGLARLAEIFYRFKPLFLAFRTNKKTKSIINKIRKLAIKHHKPFVADYINSVTARIKRDEKINEDILKKELGKVNIFRKIRLAYALNFRIKNTGSILYRIRNGKGYATEFSFNRKKEAERVYGIILDSIVSDISKNVKGKKIYIPEYMNYTLPSTEKQFTGYFPSGSCVTVPKDMIFGVHWNDVDHNRIDLDASVMNSEVGKIGWDASYRSESADVMFSGDVTAAPKPKGASELFYVKRQAASSLILAVNYFNFEKDIEVPYKLLVAKESPKNFSQNYMVNPNNVVAVANSKIDQKQKILGVIITTTKECRFYFAETSIGGAITSRNSSFMEHSRKYLVDFYKNAISLNDVLIKCGAKIVQDKDKCDIDLSPESMGKNTILELLRK